MSSLSPDPDGSVPNRGPAVFAVTTTTLVLASVFVFSRMVSRFFIVKNVTWDDKVMLLAWLIAFFLSFTICLGVANGLGQHDADIPSDQVPVLRRCEYVFSILYNPALMATKTSILIFYLRLAKNTQTVLRAASWATLAVVNLAGIVLTFMNIFQCQPVHAAWNTSYRGKTTCIPLLTEFICAAPVNIITDLAILALPIPVLTGMRLPSRQKTILVLTFAFGIFVAVVDVVRIYYLQHAIFDVPTGATSDPKSRFGGEVDFAYNAAPSLMWSAVEVNIGMACACVPTLKPLVLRLLPSMLYDPNGSRSRTRSRTRDSSTNSKNHQDSDTHSPSSTPTVLAQPEPAAQTPLLDRHHAYMDADGPLSSVEFLASPVMHSGSDRSHTLGSRVSQARTSNTASTNHSNERGVYFGFVNMTKPKSMLRANASESFKYCTIVSILFVLWGISYGLLNTLNTAIATVNRMSTAQTLGLTSAYFGIGYFFGPLLVGEWILRRDEHSRSKRHRKSDLKHIGGYKVTFIVGLCIYGIGTIIFWPSAVTSSFGGFMLSYVVVGFGLSVLEVGANSFMILCGPSQYGETRLLLAQAVQAIGTVVSSLLAQKVFFKTICDVIPGNSMTLINVQWTYLGITLLCVVLALFFYYMPLPEVSDSELEESAKRLPIDPCKRSIGGLQLRTVSLILAVLAQYLYVGGQECNGAFFKALFVSLLPGQPKTGEVAASGTPIMASTATPGKPPQMTITIPDYMTIGQAALGVGRFVAAYFTYMAARHRRMPQPRTLLTLCIILCFVTSLLAVVLHTSNSNLMFIPLCLFFFSMGPIWPLIFAIGLRGQGRRTKRAAAFITMGGSGPGFLLFVMYAIIVNGGTVQLSFVVIVILQVIMMAYPLFLMLKKDAKLLVNPCPETRNAPKTEGEQAMDELFADTRQGDNTTLAPPPTVAGVTEKSHGVLGKVSKGLGVKLMGSRRKSSPLPEVEHSESRPGDQT